MTLSGWSLHSLQLLVRHAIGRLREGSSCTLLLLLNVSRACCFGPNYVRGERAFRDEHRDLDLRDFDQGAVCKRVFSIMIERHDVSFLDASHHGLDLHDLHRLC